MDMYLQEPRNGPDDLRAAPAGGRGQGRLDARRAMARGPGRQDDARPVDPAGLQRPAAAEDPVGRAGLPAGQEGYWISLEGIGGNRHTAEDGYGIHGTNDPASIGKAMSMGCIRLADDDIEPVFACCTRSGAR